MEENQVPKKDIPASGEAKAAGILQDALADPAMLAKLMGVIGALQGGGSPAPTAMPTASPPTAQPPVSGAPATDGLMALLSDPAFAERLPQIIAMIKPLLAATPTSVAQQSEAAVPASISPPTHSHASERDNLLLSLKPFLSGERRDAIDSILRISKLGEVIRQIK